tara:strand:+ start:811 stop:1116 length:306 start_codon:yes stop_codon:yes gene_type:complete
MISRKEYNKAPKIEGIDEIALNTDNVAQVFISEVQKQEDRLFTTALRTMAEPPIKGEITKGKIKWRGIKLIRQQIGIDFYSWLEQRGKQISPKFISPKFNI